MSSPSWLRVTRRPARRQSCFTGRTLVTPDSAKLAEKKKRALELLKDRRCVLVALSGGVDSAVLLSLALEALGPDRVLAVTGWSPSVTNEDLEDARAVARTLGAKHKVVETHELSRPGYRANEGDRCYHCRTELFEVLGGLAFREGLETIAYGAIQGDLEDYRPGMKAASERGIIAPLLEAGLTKQEVRLLASEAGLPVQDKAASPCLSSRIPAGTEVNEERLAQVAQAESAMRALGFQQFRVRYHGEVARLELDDEGDRRILDPEFRARVVEAIRGAGFRFVALDLEGYRSGSLNPSETARFYRILPMRPGGQ